MVVMKRYLEEYIQKDLKKKIILITGPRQTGKTTLSKMLKGTHDYFNYDNAEDRLGVLEKSWDRSRELVIFDELHKLKNWKAWLKGVYDTERIPPSIVVTGSAKLDTYKKVGDSLAGRFFQFRLHPFDLKELQHAHYPRNPEKDLDNLLETGGFPEPFLEGSQSFYNRWKKSHLDIILRQDLMDLENIQQISSVETLIQLLKRRVGSPISYRSLAEDLQCSDKTVKRWLSVLETMYVVFKVTPFHKNISRSLLKAPKYYFYDTGQVVGDQGVKLENLVACALLKEIHFREDCLGEQRNLYYLRDKDGREIDFLITQNDAPSHMIEVKWKGADLSVNFSSFAKYFKAVQKIQLVRKLNREKTFMDGSQVRMAHNWLAKVSLD